ncbi:unnamed protein product [Brassica rapa]|uniref:Syntaxin 6 N-terminal domain-containing protein n=2 Tax=Brassica campestris TaxID=3711 RepID=A0A8D9H0T9_BRACM|nr:unnamed protein product [Brassica rapa]
MELRDFQSTNVYEYIEGDGEEVRSVRSAPKGPSRHSWNHQMADEFQSAVLSSYNNGLKDETRDTHRDFTFAMETQVVKIEKSHKEASKGTPRWVLLEDDQDDRNELTLFLAGPSDSERKQISTIGVKVNQLQEEQRVLLMILVLGLQFLMMGYSTKLWRAICLTSKKSSQLLWRLELYGKP